MPVKTLPVTRPVLMVVAAVAIASLGRLAGLQVGNVLRWRSSGRVGPGTPSTWPHTWSYSRSATYAIENIDYGWLVLNVWHNAQYILFVWLYNNNRYKDGVVPGQRFLSTISQSRNWPFYFLTCLLDLDDLVSSDSTRFLRALQSRSTLPLFLVAYQTINFHHYVVDGLIWKVRRKRLRSNLGISELKLSPAPSAPPGCRACP